MALDAKGLPHVVFYSDEPDGVPQYQHAWFDGRAWKHDCISLRTEPFVLPGDGNLQLPTSRPEIVIDDEDRVYVIYRGDIAEERMVAQRLLPPHYTPNPAEVRVLWDKSLRYAEPVIYRLRSQRDRVLSMLIENHQPPHDVKAVYEPIYLADWQSYRCYGLSSSISICGGSID